MARNIVKTPHYLDEKYKLRPEILSKDLIFWTKNTSHDPKYRKNTSFLGQKIQTRVRNCVEKAHFKDVKLKLRPKISEKYLICTTKNTKYGPKYC